MKGKIEKAKTIIKAFTSDLPVGEAWYEERVGICLDCDYNTINKEESELSFTEKIMTKNLCKTAGQCSACGCCIAEKASVRTESCGLKEINLTPKWRALDIPSYKGDIHLETSSIGVLIDSDSTGFIYDFGIVNTIVAKTEIKLKFDKKSEFKSHKVSCGCVFGIAKNLNDNVIVANVEISTLGFREGINEKTLYINYKQKGKDIDQIAIKFRIIKKYE